MLSTNPTGPLGVRWFGNSFKLRKACTYPLSGPPTKPRWKCRLRASLSPNTMNYPARASKSPMLVGESFVFSYVFFLANNPSPRTGARCLLGYREANRIPQGHPVHAPCSWLGQKRLRNNIELQWKVMLKNKLIFKSKTVH